MPNLSLPSIFSLVLATLLCVPEAYTQNVPQVIQDIPDREWRAISLNTVSDVDPCPARDCAWSGVEGQAAVFVDWTGGAFASNEGPLGGLVYFGGGHNSYYGNEVYFFDLSTLLWTRRNDPTDGQTPGDSSTYNLDSSCRYYDGSPVAYHTYDNVDYDPVGNRFILLTPRDAASTRLPGRIDGCGSKTPALFSFASNSWSNAGSEGPDDVRNGPTAYDPNRRLFWGRGGTSSPRLFVSYDPANDTWAQYPDNAIDIGGVGAVDPTRDLFVSLEFGSSNEVTVRDLSQPSQPTVTVNRTGDTGIETSAHAPGFEWAGSLGAFVVWDSGMDIYTLTPPDGDWRTANWVWTRHTTTGADPGTVLNDSYSKFQWADNLGIGLISPSRTSPTYAIRLSEGGGGGDSSTPNSPSNLRQRP